MPTAPNCSAQLMYLFPTFQPKSSRLICPYPGETTYYTRSPGFEKKLLQRKHFFLNNRDGLPFSDPCIFEIVCVLSQQRFSPCRWGNTGCYDASVERTYHTRGTALHFGGFPKVLPSGLRYYVSLHLWNRDIQDIADHAVCTEDNPHHHKARNVLRNSCSNHAQWYSASHETVLLLAFWFLFSFFSWIAFPVST